MRRSIRRLVVGGSLAGMVGLSMLPAHAAVREVGWFTRNPAASAPPGGLQVANGPDGRISFGAVRADDGPGRVSSARLVLVESGQNVNASGASLQACPALGTWKPGKGTLEQGPKADCAAGSVPLSRDATTGQWFADVTTVLSSGTAAVAVVPGDVGGVFQINFDAPTLDVRTEEAGGGTTGSSFDASEFTSPSSAGSSGSGQTSSSTSSGSDSFSSPGSSADTMTFVPGSSSSFTPAPSTFDAGGSTDFSGDTPDGGAVADTGADVTTGSEVAGGPPTVLQPASTSDGPSGNRAAQFAFFLVTAAVIGTAAGFARHRLTAGAG